MHHRGVEGVCVFVSVCVRVCVHCRDSGAKWWAQIESWMIICMTGGGAKQQHEFPIFQEEGGGGVLT